MRYVVGFALLVSICPVAGDTVSILPLQYYKKSLEKTEPPPKSVTTPLSSDRQANKAKSIDKHKSEAKAAEAIPFVVIKADNPKRKDQDFAAIERWIYQVNSRKQTLKAYHQLSINPDLLTRYIESQFSKSISDKPFNALVQLYAVVLGEKSVSVLLAWGERYQDNPNKIRSIILAFDHLPKMPQITQFINTLLENELQDKRIISMALFYHSKHLDPTSLRWAIQFRAAGIDPSLQYIGLYLTAVLGDETAFPWIIKLLEQKTANVVAQYQRYYLHLALVKILDQVKYQQIVTSLAAPMSIVKSVTRQTTFRTVSESERLEMMTAMLHSVHVEEKLLVIDYLISTKNKIRLVELISGPMAGTIYRKSLNAGLKIENSASTTRIVMQSVLSFIKSLHWIYLLLAGVLVALALWLKLHKKPNSNYSSKKGP